MGTVNHRPAFRRLTLERLEERNAPNSLVALPDGPLSPLDGNDLSSLTDVKPPSSAGLDSWTGVRTTNGGISTSPQLFMPAEAPPRRLSTPTVQEPAAPSVAPPLFQPMSSWSFAAESGLFDTQSTGGDVFMFSSGERSGGSGSAAPDSSGGPGSSSGAAGGSSEPMAPSLGDGGDRAPPGIGGGRFSGGGGEGGGGLTPSFGPSGGGGGEMGPSGGSGITTGDDEATTNEDEAAHIYWLTYNDSDPDLKSLVVVDAGQGTHGSTVLEEDGTVTYTPDQHWSGTDTFTYTVSNGTDTATGTCTVTVLFVDYPPTADAVSASTNENVSKTVTLSGSDVEGSELTYFVDSGPAHGTLGEVNGNQLTYYPDGNFFGVDTFTYCADDGGQASEPAAVTVTVNEGTHSPGVTITPHAGSLHVAETDSGLNDPATGSDTYTVVLNTQPTDDVVVTVQPDNQIQVDQSTLTFTSQNWNVAQTITVSAVNDQVAEDPIHTGIITHSVSSADSAYNGVAVNNLTVAVADDDFAGIYAERDGSPETWGDLREQYQDSAGFTVVLTSQPTADVVVALDAAPYGTLSAYSLTFTPANWSTPQHVTATVINDNIAEGYHELDVALTGTSADANYQDRRGGLPFNVIDDDGPNALDANETTDEDTPVTFSPATVGGSATLDPPVVVAVSQPQNGTAVINLDGTITYTPNHDWNGEDEFTYTISDGHGGTDTGTVYMEVIAVNDAPVVDPIDPQYFAEGDWVSLQVVAHDVDDSGFLYTISDASPPGPGPIIGGSQNGLPPGLNINPMTGLITGWIDPHAAGFYSTTVVVDDFHAENGTGTTTINWTIDHVNHDPHLYRTRDFTTALGQAVQQPGPSAVDIDDDALSFSFAGLPSGLSYDTVNNLITGTPTALGTYTVTVTASDGFGGSDSDTYFWRVVQPGAAVPIAHVYFGTPSFNSQNATGNSMALQHPASTIPVTVVMENPNDPLAVVNVTLQITPGGRGSLSGDSMALGHGESATVSYTVAAISQRPQDVQLTAYADGAETDRDTITNVGVVLPYRIRGFDTPATMKDRISMGAGNWGSYYNTVQIAPDLKGTNSISLGFDRPANDDKYGNASADDQDVARLSRTTKTLVKIIGNAQTQPSVDENGQPDGLARNADQLQMIAIVPQVIGPAIIRQEKKEDIATVPVVVAATNVHTHDGAPRIRIFAKDWWFWGGEYDLSFKADGGTLQSVRIAEIVMPLHVLGLFEKYQTVGTNFIGPWIDPTEGPVRDYIGISDPRSSLDSARDHLRRLFANAERHKDAAFDRQYFVFYNTAKDKEEPKQKDSPVIKRGVFDLAFWGLPGVLRVMRQVGLGLANEGKEPYGVIEKPAAPRVDASIG
jgi:hypothetical protein